MWKPIYDPGPWKAFLGRKDNIGVPLMEVRKKYMEEQLLFENYMSHLQQLDTLHTINPLASAPGAAYGRDGKGDLKVFEYYDGILVSIKRYYRDPGTLPTKVVEGGGGERQRRDPGDTKDLSTGPSYRDTLNFSLTCGYTEISADIQMGWAIRGYPCGAKQLAIQGPLLEEGPTGVYGGGDTGPGRGYIVELWD